MEKNCKAVILLSQCSFLFPSLLKLLCTVYTGTTVWLTQFIFVKYMKIQDQFSYFKMSSILLYTTSYHPSWVQSGAILSCQDDVRKYKKDGVLLCRCRSNLMKVLSSFKLNVTHSPQRHIQTLVIKICCPIFLPVIFSSSFLLIFPLSPVSAPFSLSLSLSDSPLFVGFSVLIADSPLLAHTCWIPQLSPHRLVPGLLPAADHTLAAACCLPAWLSVCTVGCWFVCCCCCVCLHTCLYRSPGY